MRAHRSGLLTAIVAIAVTLGLAGPALADTASLSFTDAAGKEDPVANVGRTVTLSGNAAVAKKVYVKWRAPGGAPCAPSASSDSGNYNLNGSWSNYSFYGYDVNGDFALQRTGQWSTAGTFQFCIWFATSESVSTTPITQMITFRAAVGTISATVNPVAVQTGQQATVTLTGSSEAPTHAYATIRPAGGAPCASSYRADTGRGLVNGADVNGAFSLTATTSQDTAGTYLVCAWLADSSSSTPIAGPQPATFTVASPPPPCVVPQIAAGTPLASVLTSLSTAHCVVGKKRYTPSRTYARGTLVKQTPVAGTTLAPQGPVDLLLSSGRPCRVPAVRSGLRLSGAKARLLASGCNVGRVRTVRSRHRRGVVLRFSPGSGTRLSPGASVGIVVSRGR